MRHQNGQVKKNRMKTKVRHASLSLLSEPAFAAFLFVLKLDNSCTLQDRNFRNKMCKVDQPQQRRWPDAQLEKTGFTSVPDVSTCDVKSTSGARRMNRTQQKCSTPQSIQSPKEEAAERKERWLEEQRLACTLDGQTRKVRKAALQMLVGEALRSEQAKLSENVAKEPKPSPRNRTVPRARFSLSDMRNLHAVLSDIDVLMAESVPRRPRAKAHEALDRTKRDNYHFVASELSLLRLWQ